MATRNKRRKGNSVSVDLSGVESSRKAIPEGTYSVVVNKAEQKESQSGNPMIVFEFEVNEGTHRGAKLYENCSLQPQALFKLKAVLQGLGFPIPKGDFDLNLDELVGMTCEVEVGNEVYEGKKKSRILEYLTGDENEEEEEDEEDLGDRLSEMSLKELKDLASELDISPSKVKKAKNASSLAKLIMGEAEEDDILAALGEDDEEDEEEEEDEDDDESPDYSEMSLKELKAECKDRGLRVKKGMEKEDLIELLEEDDQE